MSYSGEVMADLPLAYWRLGESSGSVMVDSSGNGRDGTFSGSSRIHGVPSLLVGETNTAAEFTGNSSWSGSAPWGAWMNVTSGFTVEAWIKPDNVTSTRNIVIRDGTGGSRCWRLQVTSSGGLNFAVWNSADVPFEAITAGGVLTVGSTYHVVARFDGTNLTVYVNGVLVATKAFTGTAKTHASTAISVAGGGSLNRFDGVMDEVAFYGSALSEARIAAHYSAGSSATPVAWVDPVEVRTWFRWPGGGSPLTTNVDIVPAAGDVMIVAYLDDPGVGPNRTITAITGLGATWSQISTAGSGEHVVWAGVGGNASGTLSITLDGTAGGLVGFWMVRGLSSTVVQSSTVTVASTSGESSTTVTSPAARAANGQLVLALGAASGGAEIVNPGRLVCSPVGMWTPPEPLGYDVISRATPAWGDDHQASHSVDHYSVEGAMNGIAAVALTVLGPVPPTTARVSITRPRRVTAFEAAIPVKATMATTRPRRSVAILANHPVLLSVQAQTPRREITIEAYTPPLLTLAAVVPRRVATFQAKIPPQVSMATEAPRRLITFTAYSHVAVVPPPEHADAGRAVVVAQAFGPVTMVGTQPVYEISEAQIPRARERYLCDGVDITFFRGVVTPPVSYTLLEPLLYGPATLTLPQVAAAVERLGVGALSWLRKDAPFEVQRVVDGVVVGTDWKGFIVAFDVDGAALSVELGGEANGRAALRNRQVPIFPRVNDIGRQIADSIVSLGLPFEPRIGPVTGIEVMTSGGVGHLDHVQGLVAKAWTRAGRQWTVMPDPVTGVYELHRKNDSTVHATVFFDDAHTVPKLRRDGAEEPNRIFTTGVTPAGQRVRFGVYPGLVQGPVPEFPGRMVEGDTGPGVRMLILKLQAMGYLKLSDAAGGYDEDVVDAVVDLQNDAGLFDDGFTGTAVPGEVNLTTWRALYDLDVTGLSAETAHIEPAAQRAKVREWNRSGSGNIMGPNPRYDSAAIVVDRNIDMGAAGLNRSQMKEFSRAELNDHGGSGDSNDPNWVGTITFNTGALVRGNKPIGATLAPGDVMDARDLRPGMNIRAPGWDGGTLFHVAACEKSADGVVTATVDTRFRDAMEVWEVIARNAESRRDPSRSRARKHRASTMTKDSIGEWDEIGGLLGNDVDIEPGWNVFPVVAAMEGTISQLKIHTSPAAEFVAAVFGNPVGPGTLHALIGDPLTKAGTKRWEKEATRSKLDRDYGLLYAAGDNRQPLGYWPKRKGAENDDDGPADQPVAPLTGKWEDDAGFAYRSRVRHMVWVAVWSDRRTTIEGGRIMWPQLEAGA